MSYFITISVLALLIGLLTWLSKEADTTFHYDFKGKLTCVLVVVLGMCLITLVIGWTAGEKSANISIQNGESFSYSLVEQKNGEMKWEKVE